MKSWLRLGDIFINLNQVRVAVMEGDKLMLYTGIQSRGDPVTLTGTDAEKVGLILRQRSREIFKDAPKVEKKWTRPKSFSREGR